MSIDAIEYKNVCKKFEDSDKLAVSDVNLVVEEGSFVTILGTSGSGKTTLLKMTNRLYEPSSGEILFYGQDCSEMPVNEYRRQIGYVIQQAGLFPHKTIEENVATVPKLLKWDKEKINSTVREMLSLVRLDYDTYAKRYPRQLSGGEQQRVGIARALAVSPKVILMDEPFGAIDAITRRTLQEELVKLHNKLKNTILFVTHDIFEAILLGEKIIVMDKGVVQQYDTPFNIMTNPKNDFVKNLVFSGDPLEKLKALSVLAALDQLPSDFDCEGCPCIDSQSHVNDALLEMLQSNSDFVVVRDSGKPIGKITMECIKDLTGDRG